MNQRTGRYLLIGGALAVFALAFSLRDFSAATFLAKSTVSQLNANFVSWSLGSKTSFVAGESLPVTITMRNTGTGTWNPGQQELVSIGPDRNTIWGVGAVPLPQTIGPNQDVTFNFTVSAPLTAGSYPFQWRLAQVGSFSFGNPTPVVSMTVTASSSSTPPNTTSTPPTTPSSSVISVSKAGSGASLGFVSGTGISCGSDCSQTFNATSTVNLQLSYQTGSSTTFGGWSGCNSVVSIYCNVTLNPGEYRNVTSTFNLISTSTPPTVSSSVTVVKSGVNASQGYVYGHGISCGSTCSRTFGSTSTLSLQFAASYSTTSSVVFGGWAGCSSVASSTYCNVSLSPGQHRTITVTFN